MASAERVGANNYSPLLQLQALTRRIDQLKQAIICEQSRSHSKTRNKYLRHALSMPAWVASRHEAHVKAFYDQLIARGKKPLQAIVAVMRK